MADKFLNMNVSGVATPLKISNVSTITVNGAGTATTITYSDGGTATVNIAAAAAASFPPSSAIQQAAWLRGLWQVVIEGVATPWNQPMIPGTSEMWNFTVSPTAQLVGAAFSAKQATALLGTDNAAGTGAVGPVTSIT
tara:strand:- start:41 stop:454 length:414 start_codon:yes stop_codon:yes gene_type:complete